MICALCAENNAIYLFMNIFNTTCGTIEAGGNRRGAQIAVLGMRHQEMRYHIIFKR